MTSFDWTSLIYLLGIGGLFYWMMKRGGCGMHAHGHQHHDRAQETADGRPTDRQHTHHHGR